MQAARFAIESGAGVTVTELMEIPHLMRATRIAAELIAKDRPN